jgi:hypothetical protein
MRGNNFQKVSNVGLVWLEFSLGEKDKNIFLANKFSEWLLHVAEWHMSNTSPNK